MEFLDPDMPTPSAFEFTGGYDTGDDITPKKAGKLFHPTPVKQSIFWDKEGTEEDTKAKVPVAKSQYIGLYNKELAGAHDGNGNSHVLQTFPRTHHHHHPSPDKTRDVFERLTDHRFFTGIHRERFDEKGNGRGLAGREYVYIHDGSTESASRVHEVYSTVLRKPYKKNTTAGTLGIQKYGVQISTPKLMWLYRNGDKFHEGTPFYVRPFIKSMDTLFMEMGKDLQLIAGPIRKIYDQNLHPVTRLDEIVDGAKYLCTSGEAPAPANRLGKFMSEWVVQKLGH